MPKKKYNPASSEEANADEIAVLDCLIENRDSWLTDLQRELMLWHLLEHRRERILRELQNEKIENERTSGGFDDHDHIGEHR